MGRTSSPVLEVPARSRHKHLAARNGRGSAIHGQLT
jgi:hypothetical protein